MCCCERVRNISVVDALPNIEFLICADWSGAVWSLRIDIPIKFIHIRRSIPDIPLDYSFIWDCISLFQVLYVFSLFLSHCVYLYFHCDNVMQFLYWYFSQIWYFYLLKWFSHHICDRSLRVKHFNEIQSDNFKNFYIQNDSYLSSCG